MNDLARRNLARSADGLTIHRAECRHARVPWLWAENATDDELLEAKLYVGLRVCKVCTPSFRRRPELRSMVWRDMLPDKETTDEN